MTDSCIGLSCEPVKESRIKDIALCKHGSPKNCFHCSFEHRLNLLESQVKHLTGLVKALQVK